MGELEELASYCEDGVKTVDGMACRVFDGGKLLMPLAGACDTLGSIGFKQTNGGYWGSGEDVEGHGSVMMLGTDDFYVFVHYNLPVRWLQCAACATRAERTMCLILRPSRRLTRVSN